MTLCVMGNQPHGSQAAPAALRAATAPGPDGPGRAGAQAAVTSLYEAHALGLLRLAHVMLGEATCLASRRL